MGDAQPPLITVLMSVYNAEKDLKDSIESILSQAVKDFEFLIINDGSTDASFAIMEGYAARDKRIRIIDQQNKGLTKSLNIGVKEARGTYIARQDADDISYPIRFEKQLELFNNNGSVVLVGGVSDDVYPDGSTGQWRFHDEASLQKIVFLKTPFPHSTVMMRTDICRELGGYDESYRTAQDMELWMRFAGKGRLAMVEDPILKRRVTRDSITAQSRGRQFYDALRARWSHNKGLGRLCALYHAVRSLIIGLLPPGLVLRLKDALK